MGAMVLALMVAASLAMVVPTPLLHILLVAMSIPTPMAATPTELWTTAQLRLAIPHLVTLEGLLLARWRGGGVPGAGHTESTYREELVLVLVTSYQWLITMLYWA